MMFKQNKLILAALIGAAVLGGASIPAIAQSQAPMLAQMSNNAQASQMQPQAANVAAASAAPAAKAGTVAGQVFGNAYVPVQAVGPQQAQIVYYRPAVQVRASGAANVYVDGEYQTSLLPTGYTTFCVAAGKHTLGSYLNEAPLYAGKTTDRFEADLKGGMTYFLKVREDGKSGAPLPLARAEAERELSGAREQVHALSRASSVQACQYSAEQPTPVFKDYTLSGDMLFAFGKSGYNDINPEGRQAIGQLVEKMRADGASLKRIVVIGHADQIGSNDSAHALGEARAETVRRLLIDRGINASSIQAQSAGNTEPVVEDCKGTKQQKIACYAPNRRVVVRVDMSRPG